MPNAIAVEGLVELRKALLEAGGLPLQKKLRARFLKIGQEVAAEAKTHVPVKTGRARDSIRAGASGTTAYVAGGKSTVSYYGWLEYGGVLKPTGNRRNTISRPRKPGGRYLYPAIEKKRDRIQSEALEAFRDSAREVGFTRS